MKKIFNSDLRIQGKRKGLKDKALKEHIANNYEFFLKRYNAK